MKIGLMGGTFNPIHNGHLIISEYVREVMDLDKVIFIPSGDPPHKESSDLLNAAIRKDMTLLATLSNSKFDVSTIEIDRKGKSYTVDTIMELREKYKEDELFFIIGSDSLFQLRTWRNFEELLSIANFIVANRPGDNHNDIYMQMKILENTYGASIKKVDTPLISISSTDIRSRIAKGFSIKYLVPESVENYIIKQDLYK